MKQWTLSTQSVMYLVLESPLVSKQGHNIGRDTVVILYVKTDLKYLITILGESHVSATSLE